jgi:GT2 family glycosyltransferase
MADVLPWRILHLDLAAGVPSLEAGVEEAGVFVVFWWRDVPLGQATLSATRLPLPAGAVRALALDAVTPAVGDRLFEQGFRAPLPEYVPRATAPPGTETLRRVGNPFAAAAARVEALEASAPDATTAVIICTRERPDDLRACLDALAALRPAADELLVVDNAPTTDATRRVVEEAVGRGQAVRYVLEPRPGLSIARNTGLRASTAGLIAFTDDDVTVHPKWLLRLRAAFTGPEVMAATGLMLPAELETEAQQLFQWNHGGYGWNYRALTFDRAFLDRTRWRGTPVWHIGAGASMAFRREAFARVGGFDERLGAGASGCSEDSELWYRLLAAGYVCRYEPSSVVLHTHRRSMEGVERQLHDYMRGHVTALLAQYEEERHPGDLLRACYWLPRYYGGWVLRRALGRKGGPSLLGAQIRGFAAGFGHYLRHRSDPAAPPLFEEPPSFHPSHAR